MSRTRRTTQFSGEILNKIQIKLPALSVNESMARAAVAAFVSQLDPGVTEIADIKCAVSEAVTNAIVHGYRDTPETGSISITVSILSGRAVKIEIKDKAMSAQPKLIETKKGAKPESKRKPKKELKESAPVSAARFSIKEREALQCLAEIAENHTADVLDKASALMDQADKLTNISILYREYIETVKEMIK